MKTLFYLSFLLTFFSATAGDKNKNRNPETSAGIEAIVVTSQCGYMLQLNNGQLIRPVNLPKKFQRLFEKVVITVDDLKPVYNSPCDVQKEVHIVSIHAYRLDRQQQSKF